MTSVNRARSLKLYACISPYTTLAMQRRQQASLEVLAHWAGFLWEPNIWTDPPDSQEVPQVSWERKTMALYSENHIAQEINIKTLRKSCRWICVSGVSMWAPSLQAAWESAQGTSHHGLHPSARQRRRVLWRLTFCRASDPTVFNTEIGT